MKNDNDKITNDQVGEEIDQTSEEHIENIEELAEDPKDKRIADLELQAKRYLADYQNLQRRTQEQKSEWIRSANRDLLLKMLPVLDTLMLAQKHIQDKGLQISIDQFFTILEQEGVTRIKTFGEEFTPHLMEAIGTMDGDEGKVLEEVRAGFKMHEAVLRSAQVIVGSGIKKE
ncbi:MAG: nucleotide exchange factor GrpE [Patescibacteria group bacterium]|nr:nucleotide exchange factor GrpE [Patescibacteria group bacterium]